MPSDQKRGKHSKFSRIRRDSTSYHESRASGSKGPDPGGWSSWEWNETYQCESRWKDREDGSGPIFEYRNAATIVPHSETTSAVLEESHQSIEDPYGENDEENYALSSQQHRGKHRIDALTNSYPAQLGHNNEMSHYASHSNSTPLVTGMANLGLGSQRISGDASIEFEKFDRNFRLHYSGQFRQFRVLKMVWPEPEGSTLDQVSQGSISVRATGAGKIYAKVRRFVIIQPYDGHCLCLSISTYLGKGMLKKGVRAEHHTVIHTATTAAKYLPGEKQRGLSRTPIAVDADTPRDKLDAESRLNYAKIYTIEYNVKVCFIGSVHKKCRRTLLKDYNDLHPQVIDSSEIPSIPEDAFAHVGGFTNNDTYSGYGEVAYSPEVGSYASGFSPRIASSSSCFSPEGANEFDSPTMSAHTLFRNSEQRDAIGGDAKYLRELDQGESKVVFSEEHTSYGAD